MSTLTISLSGSAITGLTGTPSKSYTVSDADLQSLLTWFAQSPQAGSVGLPANPTNPQILLAWVQWWVSMTIGLIQQFQQQQTPPPINIS